jgi:hypothetical protein
MHSLNSILIGFMFIPSYHTLIVNGETVWVVFYENRKRERWTTPIFTHTACLRLRYCGWQRNFSKKRQSSLFPLIYTHIKGEKDS